jgi:AraC-like DNA-binding protein
MQSSHELKLWFEASEPRDDLLARLDRSRDYLADRLAEPISLEEAGRQAYLSPFHYHRLFARTFGETPDAFLTRLRMERARRLLIGGDRPVTEVCLTVGYQSLGTFSARFHRAVGSSPSAPSSTSWVPAAPPAASSPTLETRKASARPRRDG